MATASILLCSLAICLVMQPNAASIEDFLAPILSPIFDRVCDSVVCGKGNCTVSSNQTIPFVCDCDPGWKQIHVDDHLRFLPCVIPNCSLDFSCRHAIAPSPPMSDNPINHSVLDPCLWSYCGEGTCVKTSAFGHRCNCREGYANLLNVTSLPCFTECVLGADCMNLGLGLGNRPSTSSPPILTNNGSTGNSQACSGLSRNLLWLTTLMATLAMVL